MSAKKEIETTDYWKPVQQALDEAESHYSSLVDLAKRISVLLHVDYDTCLAKLLPCRGTTDLRCQSNHFSSWVLGLKEEFVQRAVEAERRRLRAAQRTELIKTLGLTKAQLDLLESVD